MRRGEAKLKTLRWRFLIFSFGAGLASAQVPGVEPQIMNKPESEGRVTVIETTARFVSAVRLPEAVNSVVVGDPSVFQVEHSEREPKLVFVKALTTKPAETNLLISTVNGRIVSLLLVNRGEGGSTGRSKVSFLLNYEVARGFLVEPASFPFALVDETVSVGHEVDNPRTTRNSISGNLVQRDGLDQLLEQQKRASLPTLFGENVRQAAEGKGRVRAGVSRVIDSGDRVIALFAVVNASNHDLLLMPPQVQLAGRTTSGKVVRHSHWSTSEQLPVDDFRLSRRRLGPGERVDGAVLFARPPYKQSTEVLLLQVAESGAVDRPALAPIGFGVSTSWEDNDGRGK
jgi:hypothetical protein